MDSQNFARLCHAGHGVCNGITNIQHLAYLSVLESANPLGSAMAQYTKEWAIKESGQSVKMFATHLCELCKIINDVTLRDKLTLLHSEPVSLGDYVGNSYTEVVWEHALQIYRTITSHIKHERNDQWEVDPNLDPSRVSYYWEQLAFIVRTIEEIDTDLASKLLEREYAMLRRTVAKNTNTGKPEAFIAGLDAREQKLVGIIVSAGRRLTKNEIIQELTRDDPSAATGKVQDRLSSLRERNILTNHKKDIYGWGKGYGLAEWDNIPKNTPKTPQNHPKNTGK